MPLFSLPNSYGIGSLGHDAYNYVDFLYKSNIKYWQLLPLNPTSYGDSPYQSFSAFAGNPYFIDLETLQEKGYLTKEEVDSLFDESTSIDYEKLYKTRFNILYTAYKRFDKSKMNNFIKENKDWLEGYSLFMTIKNSFNDVSFLSWPSEYITHDEDTIDSFIKDNQDRIDFWNFIQYEFYEEYFTLKEYANSKGVYLIGDMPIYVSLDSSDVWNNKNEFLLDERYNPTLVAGVPPDYFSPNGQLWGNPLYDYDYMKKNNYSWWIKRIKAASKMYDLVRIDHFRGFESFYAIKAGESTAINGTWIKGPGASLFKEAEKCLGKLNIIAENLGLITKEVDDMINELGYPGMKVSQFSFKKGVSTDAAFFNLEYNCVCYPGTHDNEPIRSWFNSLDQSMKEFIMDRLFIKDEYDIGNALIRAVLNSVCKYAIIPMWDYLQKGHESRINTPSTMGNNWKFRIEKNDLNDDLANYINHLQYIYCRNMHN